jgi:hypothetical protein
MSLKQPPKTVVINGQELPVIPAEAVETIKNKRTGKVYDFQQDVGIKVASLSVFGKTK